MAPSSLKKMGAAVAYATAVKAATQSYQLSEEYTADNFFDKFDFFVSTYESEDSWDPTHGYVQYRSQADAESLGLISTSDGQVYLGPDTKSTYDSNGKGRDSIRITSKSSYNGGLMIANFAHMPVQACGAWPAFWSYGSPWLTSGEIDYYEGWNLMGNNRMAMHTNETLSGSCTLTATSIAGLLMTQDCNQLVDGQGCGVEDDSGVWGSTTGATFAMEWTDSAIKIWSWLPSAVPSDITAGTPDPSSGAWGNPSLLVEQSNCDLASSFADQRLVFDIDFCGDTAGDQALWDSTCSAFGSTCTSHVADSPSAFTETYFMVEGIQFYEMGVAPTAASSSSSAVTSSTATSTSQGLLSGAGSALESILGASPTSSSEVVAHSTTPAAVHAPTETSSHTTSYIYATSTSTDDAGLETTVVVVADTTICPITASEASASSALASATGSVVEAETTPSGTAASATSPPAPTTARTTVTRSLTSTATELTTSTVFSTASSIITSCPSGASPCNVGDETTVVVAVSTTICPVTATEASIHGPSGSTGISVPSPATSRKSTAQATPGFSQLNSTVSTHKASLTRSSAASLATSKVTKSAKPSSTRVLSVTDTSGALETASSTPNSMATETADVASATSTASGVASSTEPSSATETDKCSNMNCIVVSNSASKTGAIGASGIALAVLAGAMFLM